MPDDDRGAGGVPRFTGDDETLYSSWRMLARARLFKLENTPKEAEERERVARVSSS